MRELAFAIGATLLFASLSFAEEAVLEVGVAYTNSRLDLVGPEKGGMARLGVYATLGIFRYGGFGGVLLTDRSILGEGGAQLGLGGRILGDLQFALMGTLGLGGGQVGPEAGACYLYGGELLIMARPEAEMGFGLLISHKQLRNLANLNLLVDSRSQFTSLGFILLL